MANDMFMDIAASGIGGRSELLHFPEPSFTEFAELPLQAAEGPGMETGKKLSTSEELKEALRDMRQRFTPFLEDLAPQVPEYRKVFPLEEFRFNCTKTVRLPHYGGPVGYARHTYECEFTLESPGTRRVYLCFEGVDYIAEVLVNGSFAGSHEGFFSPFEFDVTELVREGTNALHITVKNDCIYGGHNGTNGVRLEGDKLYAATGIGWDDSELGWHHCPPGMGIYGKVFLEYRNPLHIRDLFVRPIPTENRAEAWVEVACDEYAIRPLQFRLSLYGQNFSATLFENRNFIPSTTYLAGMGDSLTQADVKNIMGKSMAMPAQKGANLYKFSFPLESPRFWEPETPWLYQLQARILLDGAVTDARAIQFGMREFSQHSDGENEGMFWLNGKKIRLRGANTMGFEQLDAMREDWNQLIDDILLAKLCNMNFLRITQRPVQDAVYRYCDRLGLMIQTDLPLFGCMRRNKVAEGIRQAEEMERLIRSHPSCITVSYINEPFPNAKNEPHRHLERPELEQFFAACDYIVRLNNPDRVIKHVDGDYDPPTEGMPDNHCYPTWYNGHGIDIGRLHKGHWLQVKPGWYYGCGEFGTEGLECSTVMKESYPKEWLKEPFHPRNIGFAQTGDMHGFFFDAQDTMENWIEKSQQYQAFATRLMMEAFRRDRRMVSNAIHLFIDAWPSGWMKTIMDCRRNPKQAYFAYRNALEPIMVSLRTDRYSWYCGEIASVEAFLCNDTNLESDGYTLRFELYQGGRLIRSGSCSAELKNCDVTAPCRITFPAPQVADRDTVTLKAIVLNEQGQAVTCNTLNMEIFAPRTVAPNKNLVLITDLAPGVYEIAGEMVTVKECGMLPLHFVSRKTGHTTVAEFRERDFSYWYDREADMITPLLHETFTASGFTPILVSNNKNEKGDWGTALAAGTKYYMGKQYVICLVKLRQENPVAQRLLANLYSFAKEEALHNISEHEAEGASCLL